MDQIQADLSYEWLKIGDYSLSVQQTLLLVLSWGSSSFDLLVAPATVEAG